MLISYLQDEKRNAEKLFEQFPELEKSWCTVFLDTAAPSGTLSLLAVNDTPQAVKVIAWAALGKFVGAYIEAMGEYVRRQVGEVKVEDLLAGRRPELEVYEKEFISDVVSNWALVVGKISEIIDRVNDVNDLAFVLSNLRHDLFMLGLGHIGDEGDDKLGSALCFLEENLQKLSKGLSQLPND